LKTLTAPADLATQRPWAAPLYLVQIDFTSPSAKTLRLSDRYVAAIGEEWLPLVADWGTVEEALNTANVDGRPATAEMTLFNTKPIEGMTRVSDLIRSPANTTGTFEWAFAKVTVRQLFEGLGSGDEILVGVFFLEEPTDIGENLLTIRMSDQSLVLEDTLQVTRVTRDDFPSCRKDLVGRSIPRPFGILKNVPAIPVVDGPVSTLTGALNSTDLTLFLTDATDFPTSGTVQVDTEHLTYSGKSGTQLTGMARGVNGTSVTTHADKATVFQVKSGANAYRFVVGEGQGAFSIKAVTNIRLNGIPAVGPTVQLDETGLVSGKRFAMISFTPSDVRLFHTLPVGGASDFGGSISPLPITMNGGATSSATRTVSVGAFAELSTTIRTLAFSVLRSGNLVGTVNYWRVKRRISGGVDVLVAAGSFANGAGGTVVGSDVRTYASLADEVITFEFQYNNTNDGFLQMTFDNYAITALARATSGAGISTTAIVLGEVTCDLEGIKDDGSGTISGTPNLLLENPANVSRFIVTQLYGVAVGDLGTTWAASRTSLAALGFKWAALLEFTLFSQLRRRLGEQARSILYLESGKWEYEFLADAPIAQLTLDYLRDVSADLPVRIQRSSRTDVRNSLQVSAQRDYAAGGDTYLYLKVQEDLTGFPTPFKADLRLDLVQDAVTADALGAYWLSIWKRQRFEAEVVAWWNILALEKVDYLAITNHPALEAHGGSRMVFRIVGKSYLLSDAQPARIRLRAVETHITSLISGAAGFTLAALTASSAGTVDVLAALATTLDAALIGSVGFLGTETVLADCTLAGTGQLQKALEDEMRGLLFSNNGTDATNDIDIAAGDVLADDVIPDDRVRLILTSALTKQLDAAWAVGTNLGGRDTGSIANGSWHVWLIQRPDTGVVDALFSLSATAPTLPTNYTKKWRLGGILREAGVIVPFSQEGAEFLRKASVLDVSANNPGTAAVTRTLSVLTGIPVWPIMNWQLANVGTATSPTFEVSALVQNDEAPSISAAPLSVIGEAFGNGANKNNVGETFTRTNASGQVRTRVSESSTDVTLRGACKGWYDRFARGM